MQPMLGLHSLGHYYCAPGFASSPYTGCSSLGCFPHCRPSWFAALAFAQRLAELDDHHEYQGPRGSRPNDLVPTTQTAFARLAIPPELIGDNGLCRVYSFVVEIPSRQSTAEFLSKTLHMRGRYSQFRRLQADLISTGVIKYGEAIFPESVLDHFRDMIHCSENVARRANELRQWLQNLFSSPNIFQGFNRFEVAARTLLMSFTTVLDVPILQVAGHDVAVNPDPPVGTSLGVNTLPRQSSKRQATCVPTNQT